MEDEHLGLHLVDDHEGLAQMVAGRDHPVGDLAGVA